MRNVVGKTCDPGRILAIEGYCQGMAHLPGVVWPG